MDFVGGIFQASLK